MIEINIKEKKYKDHLIFENFKEVIQKGEMVAIVGKSGSGKSTLLNIIGLLDQNYNGEVIINHVSTQKMKENKRTKFIRENISYLFQNYALIDEMSVKDNLLYALEYVKKTKSEKEAMIKVCLKELGLEDKYNEKVFKLSGGQQQRIALVRTILKPSQIILADEPTGNLDDQNTKDVMAILRKINQMGKTVVVVTHNLECAKFCDRVITLD